MTLLSVVLRYSISPWLDTASRGLLLLLFFISLESSFGQLIFPENSSFFSGLPTELAVSLVGRRIAVSREIVPLRTYSRRYTRQRLRVGCIKIRVNGRRPGGAVTSQCENAADSWAEFRTIRVTTPALDVRFQLNRILPQRLVDGRPKPADLHRRHSHRKVCPGARVFSTGRREDGGARADGAPGQTASRLIAT